jgi:hypothetical protein
MLPFLKPKAAGAGGIMNVLRKPDGETEVEESMDDSGLEACATDLIRGVTAKDTGLIIDALRSAFQILDAEPHEEGEHVGEEEAEEEEEEEGEE